MASLEGVSLEFTAANRTLLSSVGGFSQPNRVQIRSLKELLETIRPLGLEFFQGHALQEQQFLGEGISYKVFKCFHRQSQRAVAVKQIKLPPASSRESFDRQVACVLRDIEVMSHPALVSHENILNIVGYGWGFRESGSIPFLVTEYATGGTMRDFLRAHSLSSREKLFLCENVARGLHELHLCGMVHGDLKLDNVLVTPYISASTLNSRLTQTVVAKIADFGHSLLLYNGEDDKEVQKYGGTLAYNAPEISKYKTAGYENLNFRKCDVWALGLLCWEALDNGVPYYKSFRIQELIAISKTDSRSASVNSESTSKVTTESILEGLVFVAAKLQDVTRQFLSSDTVKDLLSFDRTKAQELFQATLETDPNKRIADIPMLPLLLKSKTRTDQRNLGQSRTKSAEWSFEVFRPKQIAKIPYVVKVQILDDCRRLGSEPGHSIASARAAFHVSLAYFLGFGTDANNNHGIEWMSKSSLKGFQTASTFQELVEESFLDDDTTGSISSQERYRQFILEAFRKVDIPYLDVIPITSRPTFEELIALRTANRDVAELTISPCIEFPFVHYVVLYGLTSFLTPDDNINFVEPITGETPLLLACRLGNTLAVRDLLLLGADCNMPAHDGCLPIHWLWMFPTEDIKFIAAILLFPDESTLRYLPSIVEGATVTRNFSSGSNTRQPSPIQSVTASSSTYESSMLKNAGSLGTEFTLTLHRMVANKVFTNAKGLAPSKFICSISRPRYLDRQVPLQLVGTPLQFAVTVASKEAVDVLLYLGADPTFDPSVGLDLEIDNWRDRSAIHLAASLHMADFLGVFQDSLSDSKMNLFHSAWHAISESSTFERTLIHGRHSLQAARDTIAFLRGRPRNMTLLNVRQWITNQRIIEVAPEVCDIAILMAGLLPPEQTGGESLSYQLSSTDRDFLMLQCTTAACSGAYGLGKSIELLEFALSNGSSIDTSQDETQEVRAINIAIQYHRTEILDWFLEKGANLKALDGRESSPLHHMIISEFPGTSHLIRLLEAGADPNARGPLGATPLHFAVRNCHIKQASILLEYEADLTIPAIADYDSADSGEINTLCSILHCAVNTGNVELVSLILKYRNLRYPTGADTLSWKDRQGNTPLSLAALRGDAETVDLLLDNGEDLSVHNAKYFNCLHTAASGLHRGVLSILAKKSDVNAVVLPTGETPLHLVFRASQDPVSDLSLSCIMVLIDAGADMTICDYLGITFVNLVWSYFSETDRADETYIENRRKVLTKMTEQGRGISFDSYSNTNMPMLHAAVTASNEGCIQELLMLGASVGILDSIGRTPLHRCASMRSRHDKTQCRHLDQKLHRVAEILIEGGADIYGLDTQGCIPLEVAIRSHNVPITTALLCCHKLGNGTLPVATSDIITEIISEAKIPLVPSTKSNSGVIESMKKLLQVRKPKDIVTGSSSLEASLEVRFKNVAGFDRQILLKAWHMSIHEESWSCTSVFLQLGLFENTIPLKWPLGLGVLKYALEEEIGAVLIMFLGNLIQDPDPVLGDNWRHVIKIKEKRRAKELGIHLTHRLAQLIKTNSYTPILNLESLRERDYIEAQDTSMIEVVAPVEPPAQITLFDLEAEEYYDDLDQDIQIKLNKLLEKWKRNEGSFFKNNRKVANY